ncbi:NADH:ubiquinone oxidoreductase 11.6kD subunit [Lojkania enalia]|uniref:NADH dehydrogenase [ubiquinone] 1 beta subcomplex subunit 11, mitochondrial n=1 Tax=Lojkania enalia TaxID=147567 RepID=A0A9P4K771_9PLEO|nr:NADH:ubiquinone oxidoreductase 11.6kD subunit [Didymosphaeria enalia]
MRPPTSRAVALTRPTLLYPVSLRTTRPFSASRQFKAGSEPQYDPPTGWLFGVKPGEKYEKEGWEGIWYWGYFGSFALAAIAYAFKPDTSIQTWALEEARRRLEAEGILPDPDAPPKKE